MLKRKFLLFLGILGLSLGIWIKASAQEPQLSLKLTRDWGYGGFHNDIEGLFSMKVTGPADLSFVDYYVDDRKIGEVRQTPFNLQFTTDDYPLGNHNLSAVGYTAGGLEYHSNVIAVEFVPEQSMWKFILPVLGIVLLAILASALLATLGNRRNNKIIPLGAERKYGAGGGGICVHCHRPFAVPFFSFNWGFSKLAKCPFCGKWGLVRILPMPKLHQAEKEELAERVGDENRSEFGEEDHIKQEIDDSKYQDL